MKFLLLNLTIFSIILRKLLSTFCDRLHKRYVEYKLEKNIIKLLIYLQKLNTNPKKCGKNFTVKHLKNKEHKKLPKQGDYQGAYCT